MSCPSGDCGCNCHINPPCRHCVEDHDNVDGYPECSGCSLVFYNETEKEMEEHKALCRFGLQEP